MYRALNNPLGKWTTVRSAVRSLLAKEFKKNNLIDSKSLPDMAEGLEQAGVSLFDETRKTRFFAILISPGEFEFENNKDEEIKENITGPNSVFSVPLRMDAKSPQKREGRNANEMQVQRPPETDFGRTRLDVGSRRLYCARSRTQ